MSVWDGTFRLEQIPEPPSEFALVLTAASDVHSPISCIRVQGTASEPKIICAIQQGCLTILQNNEHARKMLCQEGAMKLFDQFAALGDSPSMQPFAIIQDQCQIRPGIQMDMVPFYFAAARLCQMHTSWIPASHTTLDTHHRAERFQASC